MASSPTKELCYTKYETQPVQSTDGAGAAELAFSPFSFFPGIYCSTLESHYNVSLHPSARPAAVGGQLQSSLTPEATATDEDVAGAGSRRRVDALAHDVELSVSDMFTWVPVTENPGKITLIHVL